MGSVYWSPWTHSNHGKKTNMRLVVATVAVVCFSTTMLAGDEEVERNQGRQIGIAGGKVKLALAENWEQVQPRVNFIEHELRIPRAEGDAADGRLTIMSAGGTVQANIDRWLGQFKASGGEKPKNMADPAQEVIGGIQVHWVDVRGTYLDQRGPFAPKQERPDYRVLATILEIPKSGRVFVKFYGPQATVKSNAAAFAKMIKGLRVE